MDEENRSNSFLKEQAAKAKDKLKDETKKKVQKKVMIFIATHAVLMLIILAITMSFIVIILLAAWLNTVINDKENEASDAKNSAINMSLDENQSNTNTSNAKINIIYEDGKYIMTNTYTDEELNSKKEEFIRIGKNPNKFSDLELRVISALMDNGLNIRKFKDDELKCLPLFIKAEACTSYLDLRPNSEKFDGEGNYKPEEFKDLAENEMVGTILVQRSNTKDDSVITLEYKNRTDFDKMINDNDENVINYFTISDNNALIVARRFYQKVEVSGEYPEGVEQALPNEQYRYEKEEIPYNEYVKKYVVPFEFLVQFMVQSANTDFSKDLANLVIDSKIIIGVKEEERTTLQEKKEIYNVHNKTEKTLYYSLDDKYYTYTFNKTQDSDNKACATYKEEQYEINKTITDISYALTCEIIEADIWCAKYEKKYELQEKEEVTEQTEYTNPPQEYTYLENKYNVKYKNEAETDADVKNYIKKLEPIMIDENGNSRNLIIQSVEEKYYNKIEQENILKMTITKYPKDENPEMNTKYYVQDEDGNNIKLLGLYDKYPEAKANIDSASSWLYESMQENEKTKDLANIVKNLTYLYDARDDISITLDPTIFDGEIIKTDEMRLIVKTDETGALPTLNKAQIEKIINNNFSEKAKDNLLGVIEDLLYIQDEYKVNAVFAIVVFNEESTCGTKWDLIDESIYNWASIQGPDDETSYKDREGTPWRIYNSFNEATRDFGDWIATGPYYFMAKKYTIKEIGSIYSNTYWSEKVSKEIIKMYASIGISVNASNGTAVQQRIAEIARNSNKYGITATKGWCQAWVSEVCFAAGANSSYAGICCPKHAAQAWGVSKEWSKIQIGATVYGDINYQGVDYGHVGIYIGDGQVAHNIGGVAIEDIEDWIKKYDGICWGWNGGNDLTGGLYPCKNLEIKVNH